MRVASLKPKCTAQRVYCRRGNSIKAIYRLYSCSLPDTFSNGTLGTGFCESCRPDSRPARGETDRKNKMLHPCDGSLSA